MLGAIVGDIVGSRFEWRVIKSKDFPLFTEECRFTDDTVMTLAVAAALISWRNEGGSLAGKAVLKMREFGRLYPNAGYGGMFSAWLASANPAPYNSFGNGAAMRVSPAAYAGETLEEVRILAREITAVTHNHPEGIRGAEATATAVFLARKGKKIRQSRLILKEIITGLTLLLMKFVPLIVLTPRAREAFLKPCRRFLNR